MIIAPAYRYDRRPFGPVEMEPIAPTGHAKPSQKSQVNKQRSPTKTMKLHGSTLVPLPGRSSFPARFTPVMPSPHTCLHMCGKPQYQDSSVTCIVHSKSKNIFSTSLLSRNILCRVSPARHTPAVRRHMRDCHVYEYTRQNTT